MKRLALLLVVWPVLAFGTPEEAFGTPEEAFGTPEEAFGTPEEAFVGDIAQNLYILPPWTLRACPKELYATYDKEQAVELKKRDADCEFWKAQYTLLQKQLEFQTQRLDHLKKVAQLDETMAAQQKSRIQELMQQLKAEVAEKNAFKYRTNYGWVYLTVGVVLAAVGVSFGVGMAVTHR